MTESVYSTDNPETVTAYLDACRAERDALNAAVEAARTLGGNNGVFVSTGPFGDRRIVGLAPDPDNPPPAGWTKLQRNTYLTPGRGKAGERAENWLADLQPPTGPRAVMDGHGLPRYAKSSHESASFAIRTPEIFEHDGTVWALYRGHVEGECTWTPRRLSEYHAAKEAMQAANEKVSI